MADGRSIPSGVDRGAAPVAELAYLRRLGGVNRALPAGPRQAAVACLVRLLSSPSERIALAAAQALVRLDGGPGARRRAVGPACRDRARRAGRDDLPCGG